MTNTFNTDWQFHVGDLADSISGESGNIGWKAVTLPHDWSIEGPFEPKWASATGFLPTGIGWYRKRFSAPRTTETPHVFVHFDGVYCNSEVWINGHYLGKRPNGFVSFRYDLTPHLVAGGDNLLLVKVDHSQFADCRWYPGSGINRDVHLISTNAVHIKQWGVFATTPVVNEHEAQVEVEVALCNRTSVAANVRVQNQLLREGAVVAQASTPTTVAPHGEETAHNQLQVLRPDLWSVQQPSLYVLRTTIERDGQVIDEEETRIGLRDFRFDADTGFFLNGDGIKLKGVCLHDDAGALGTAVPRAVWKRRLDILKEAGTNAIRMAHNPHMPELYDLCDEMGFLVQDEAFDEWEGGKNKWIEGWNVGTPGKDGYSQDFAAWSEADLRDTILQNRNHPSIIMWSIGNEIDYPNDPYTHEILDVGTNPQIYGRGFQPALPHADRLGEIAHRLANIARNCDATRPITAALAAAIVSNETTFPGALDVVGTNYQEYRYAEDHARFPTRVLYGSENGMAARLWHFVRDNDFISGQFLWTGIDYLGEARQWPQRSNTSGLLDLAGFKKPEFYLRQSLWTTAPMIFIATCSIAEEGRTPWSFKGLESDWNGVAGETRRVVCFSNCERVELLLNGESLGVQDFQTDGDGAVFWDVPFEAGTLMAKGFTGTQSAEFELHTAGAARKIVAEADITTLQADGVDIAHISASVADEHGVIVWTSDHEITWTVSGPARLLGLESGDCASHESYQSTTRRAFHGKMLGYVQSAHETGQVQIELSAPGLEGTQITLQTKA